MGVGQRDTRANAATVTVAASDSPFRTRADYVCDGTDDATEINLAIEKIKSIGGKVRLMGGHFYLHAAGILQRQAITLEGEGLNATFIQPGTGHSLAANSGLITLETLASFTGGGIRGVSLIGDGTISGSTGRAALDATLDGINATGVDYLYNFYIENNAIHKFRRGWNGHGVHERYVPLNGNEIYYNTYGVYIGEHPNPGLNDVRYNDIAFGGTPYDCNFNGTKICYNRIGVTGSAGSAITGTSHCFFSDCEFFHNTEASLILVGYNKVSGSRFGEGNKYCNSYIQINGDENAITGGCRFYTQVAPYGATTGTIRFRQPALYNNQITNCHFRNPAGPAFGIDSNYVNYGLKIDGNTFVLNGNGILNEAADGGKILDSSFCNNNIWLSGPISNPIIYLGDHGSSTGGNRWDGNGFYTASAENVPTCVFKGDLSQSSFCRNDLNRMIEQSVPIFDAETDFTNAAISDNQGYGPYSPMICNHGATAATARPPWPGVVQWMGTVEPTNMIDGDVWINTG